MDAEYKKLKKIVSFMKKEGVLNYKSPSFEVSLSPMAIRPNEAAADIQTPEPESNRVDNQYSEQDALFWSAPGSEEPLSDGTH